MFSIYSPRRGGRVLLTDRHIRRLHNIDGAIVVEVESDDGEVLFTVTGRRAPTDPARARQLVMSLVANRRAASSPNTAA